MPVHILDRPGTSQMLDYVVNIYCKGQFVKAYRFQGFSGTAVHDEIKYLRRQYPEDQGYTLDW